MLSFRLTHTQGLNLRLISKSSSSHTRMPVAKRFIHDFKPERRLNLSQVNKNVIEAQYAVRGLIPSKAEELREELLKPTNNLPFDKIINANIGNPQQLKQKPLSFYRSVLSILQNPKLLETEGVFAQDVLDRAKTLLNEIGSVGAYSHSQGVPYIRKQVANYIQKRDGTPGNPNDIYLTTGASDAVKLVLQVLLEGTKQDGVLIPIPQYPLYTASLALFEATPIPYYLKEEENWSINVQEIETLIVEGKKFGIKPKALVVINPGNPTGATLSETEIEAIITIAAKHGVVIIADEVYQENTFDGYQFHSFKKILSNLQKHTSSYDTVQLASLHSVSKGVTGECGQRAGYVELYNFKPEIMELFTKLASISLCSVVSGQALIEMMVNPPKEGDESYETDQAERKAIHESYANKADLLYNAFSKLKNIEVQKPQGAMYLFPKIIFSDSIISVAKSKKLEPDVFYCLELLNHTGICCVPGSGFGQVEGTFHVRTTFLPEGEEWIKQWATFHTEFFEKYSD